MATANSNRIQSVCSVEGCNKARKPGAKQCAMHATRLRRERYAASGIKCCVAQCNCPIDSMKHMLCQKHLAKLRRYGDPEHQLATPEGEPLEFLRLLTSQMPLPNQCILWPYGYDVHGYGAIWLHNPKRNAKAHRVSLALYLGMSPDNLPLSEISTRHLCPGRHNRLCVNPLHLAFGTHQENMIDVIHEGSQKGELNPMAKITEADVRYIRESTLANHELAIMFNVKTNNIWRIRNRKRWKHVA